MLNDALLLGKHTDCLRRHRAAGEDLVPIAQPAVKGEIPAETLGMAASETLNSRDYGKLARLAMALSPRTGTDAMLSGGNEINSHLTSHPRSSIRRPKILRCISVDCVT